ncbi:hypothetical protein ACLB1E_34000 [Escherichia coli]
MENTLATAVFTLMPTTSGGKFFDINRDDAKFLKMEKCVGEIAGRPS